MQIELSCETSLSAPLRDTLRGDEIRELLRSTTMVDGGRTSSNTSCEAIAPCRKGVVYLDGEGRREGVDMLHRTIYHRFDKLLINARQGLEATTEAKHLRLCANFPFLGCV